MSSPLPSVQAGPVVSMAQAQRDRTEEKKRTDRCMVIFLSVMLLSVAAFVAKEFLSGRVKPEDSILLGGWTLLAVFATWGLLAEFKP